MRLTINLDEDLYAIGKGLAQAEGISLSQAINHLLRWATQSPSKRIRSRRHPLSGLSVSIGRRLITPADVRMEEQEGDSTPYARRNG